MKRKWRRFARKWKHFPTSQKVLIGVFLLVFLILGGMVSQETRYQLELDRLRKDYESAVFPIQLQIEEYRKEIEEVKKEFDDKINGKSQTLILIQTLRKGEAEKIIMDLQEEGFTGSFLLSESEFPGEPDCLSLERFHELIDSGWSYCLQIGALDDGLKTLTRMEKRLEMVGISKSLAFFLPSGQQAQISAKDLLAKGYRVFVSHARLEDWLGEGKEQGAVTVLARSWNSPGIYSIVEKTAASSGGQIALLTGGSSAYDRFERDQFIPMLEQLNHWEKKYHFEVVSFSETNLIDQERKEQIDLLVKEREEKVEKLQNEISLLKKQVTKLREEYVEAFF